MKFTVEWLKAALIRALRTAAQVALGMFTVGMALHEVEWMKVLSVAITAAIYSLITSAATKLPELEKDILPPDGSIVVDESDPDLYGVAINFGNKTIEDIVGKQQVVLDVKTGSAGDTKEYEAQH